MRNRGAELIMILGTLMLVMLGSIKVADYVKSDLVTKLEGRINYEKVIEIDEEIDIENIEGMFIEIEDSRVDVVEEILGEV